MTYATEGHAGSAFERRTSIPEFQTGLRARSTDSQDWIYVRASGSVAVGPCKPTKVGDDWIVTSAAGTFTNPAAFTDGQYGWIRQTYYLPDEAAEVAYDDTVTNWGVSSLQGAIEYIFANFTPSTPSLDSLTDVTITAPSNGDALIYNGALWVNQGLAEYLALDDLSDVSTSGAISGSIIRHNGVSWIIAADNDHSHVLADITDAGTLAGLNSVGTSEIANDAVTFTKMQNLGAGTIIGRYTASTGDPQAVTISTGLTLNSGTGNLTANVQTVFGRTGAVVSAASDYDASQIDNDSGVTGSFVDDALDWLNANKAALSHTHTASAITDFAEAVDDRVAALVVAGTGMTITYNDVANTLTFESSGGSGVTDGDKGDITVSASGATWTIDNDVVTYAKMQNISATSRILGRITAGAGDTEELTGSNVRTITGLATTDSPQFTGIELGNASDTTLARASAGNMSIEGNIVYRAGGTDVPVADGGLGVSSLTAYAVICGGTTSAGAVQSIAGVGTSGQVLTSNGAGALPTFQDASGGVSESWVKLTSNNTLTSSTTTQPLFDGGGGSANGALTLATGQYFFECMLHITSMSATSGNGEFEPLGAGTATMTEVLFQVVGTDSDTPLTTTGKSGTGGTSGTANAASMVLAATGTGLLVNIHGTFNITVTGTIIPSIDLVTAAAAVVNTGSYFRCVRVGATGDATGGSWS